MWTWGIFIAIVVVLLVFDMGFLNRRDHEIGVKESLWLSAFYVTVAFLFGVWVWFSLGTQKMSEYYTGYLVEQSLSLDNLFVISLIFRYFAIPRQFQHRVLFWGILGVIVFRGIMIGLGAVLVARFEWILYVFAVFLIIVGIKLLFVKENKSEVGHNPLLRFLKRHFSITHELHGHRFWIKTPTFQITPLFIALILIETADVMFAVDSIPAIFVITKDPYIVYTSNIFAILGLRCMYFALDAIMARFVYLQYALSVILIFIGSKVFIAEMLHLEKFPLMLSLGVTFGLLALGIGFSLWKTRHGHAKHLSR